MLSTLSCVYWPSVCLLWRVYSLKIFLNWRLIALQNFVVFCHTSTRISHRNTHVPSLSDLPPIFLSIPPFSLSQSPCLSSLSHKQIPIGYLFDIRPCKFLLLSPYISPSPSFPPPMSIGLFSMSVSPWLPWKLIHQYSFLKYFFKTLVNFYLLFPDFFLAICWCCFYILS